MRKDPYQQRARELCAAAGIDPDSRVGEGRGRPAWCDYRDVATGDDAAHRLRVIDPLFVYAAEAE